MNKLQRTAVAVIGVVGASVCLTGCYATSKSHSHLVGSGTALTEVLTIYPGATEITMHEASGNPNYLSWRTVLDGKKVYCTATATAVVHTWNDPHSLVGQPWCAPDVGQ